jgi:hypothetical protein
MLENVNLKKEQCNERLNIMIAQAIEVKPTGDGR